jgi:hypothetical protein
VSAVHTALSNILMLHMDMNGYILWLLTAMIIYQIISDIFILVGELFFVTDRGSGFWNVHKWVIIFLPIIELFLCTIQQLKFGSSYGRVLL